MVSKGRVQAEELRGQFGERLPGAYQAAARAMGMTTQELAKATEQGEIVAEDLLPKLSEELLRMANSGGQLEAAMNNTNSAINRFGNNVLLANARFNEAGFDKSIRDLMNTLSDAIMKAEPLWIALGKISEFVFMPLRAGIELFGSLASKLGILGDAAEGNETKIKLFGLALASVFRWSRKLLAVFLLIPAAFSGVSKLLDGEQLTWQEWALTLAGIAASLGMILSTLTRIKGIRNVISGGTSTGAANVPSRPTPIVRSDWSRSGSSTIWQRLGQSAKRGIRGPGFLPIGAGSTLSEEEFVQRSQEVPWWDLIGRLEAKQAEINNRGNTVQGDININIEGNDPLQIGGEVERVINGIFRDSSMNEPSTEK